MRPFGEHGRFFATSAGDATLPVEQDLARKEELADLASRVKALETEVQLPALQDGRRELSPAPDRQVAIPDEPKTVEERMAAAPSYVEAMGWATVRREVKRQDLEIERERHQILMEKVAVGVNVGGSLVAISIGACFIYTGQFNIGLFCIGAGLHRIAPDLVTPILGRLLGGGR
ncbi:hypothetical protein [Methylobacterium sp. Leaf86]|uniref:hypothetical protein n=1 Tax=Methylobacterium sp. Leaf86 TaxID=1736242 RepID=UPI0012E7DAED|nr:hypothetical protein [Methylobacterium sp. Leaf86]